MVRVNGNSYTAKATSPATAPTGPKEQHLWEPRESKKGDVARAVFYYYTMYPDEARPFRMWRPEYAL